MTDPKHRDHVCTCRSASPDPALDAAACARLLHNASWQVSSVHNGGSAPFDEPIVPCSWCISMGERLAYALAAALRGGSPNAD